MNAPNRKATADVAELERPGTELALVTENPVAVITDEKRFDDFLTKMRDHVRAQTPDVSTAKGREAIKSLAFKVTKSKTALEAAAKALKEEAQTTVNKVNASIRRIREDLDELAAETRAPLTEWEEAEARRVAACKETMDRLTAAAVITYDDTVETVSARPAEVKAVKIDEATFKELLPLAQQAQTSAVASMTAAVARLTQEEADRAELERLRQEAAERTKREEADRLAAEEREWQAAEADRRREEEQQAAALAEQRAEEDRIVREEAVAAAAEAARREAAQEAANALLAAEREAQEAREAEAQRAADEQRQRDEAHAQALAEAQRERDEAVAAQEAQRAEQERQERLAATQAEEQRRADAARTADRAHRSEIMGAAKAALMESCELTEEVAKRIVLTICAGDVPHVSLRF